MIEWGLDAAQEIAHHFKIAAGLFGERCVRAGRGARAKVLTSISHSFLSPPRAAISSRVAPRRVPDSAPCDIVVALGGAPVAGSDDLQRILTGQQIGRRLPMAILRATQKESVAIVPAESLPIRDRK